MIGEDRVIVSDIPGAVGRVLTRGRRSFRSDGNACVERATTFVRVPLAAVSMSCGTAA